MRAVHVSVGSVWYRESLNLHGFIMEAWQDKQQWEQSVLGAIITVGKLRNQQPGKGPCQQQGVTRVCTLLLNKTLGMMSIPQGLGATRAR